MPEDPTPITITTTASPPTPALPPAGARTRTDIAIGWTVGHVAELSGITVPLVIGAFTTAWLDLLSVAVAAWWAVHEYREHRVRADIARHALTAHHAAVVRELPATTTSTPDMPWRRDGGHQ